jgi:hypothetical protein
MDENDLVYSKYCQSVTRDGLTVNVKIYSSGKNDWILEVVDEDNNSTVWDDQFETDDEAFQEFERTLKEEGLNNHRLKPEGLNNGLKVRIRVA